MVPVSLWMIFTRYRERETEDKEGRDEEEKNAAMRKSEKLLKRAPVLRDLVSFTPSHVDRQDL